MHPLLADIDDDTLLARLTDMIRRLLGLHQEAPKPSS
jgi:hypothetical protein